MKIDRDAKTPMDTEESIQPDSRVSPRTDRDEKPDRKQADDLPGMSPGFLPNEAEAEVLAAKVNQLPEMRSEKVASIVLAIQSGRYQVSAEQIAQAIISEMEAGAQRNGQSNEGIESMDAPHTTRLASAGPPAEPMTLYSRQESGSKRRRRGARPSSSDDECRKDSEPLHDRTDRSA